MNTAISEKRLAYQLGELAQAWGNRYGVELSDRVYVAWGSANLFLVRGKGEWCFVVKGGDKTLLEAAPYLLYKGHFKALRDKLEVRRDKKLAKDMEIATFDNLLEEKGPAQAALHLLQEQHAYLNGDNS